LIQAMSSPMVVTFQPLNASGGISIARLVLPQADGKRGAMYVFLARGRLHAEDQHVLGEPAFVARHHRCDAQREAFLAEQRVAAIARAERPDLARLREMHDPLVLVIARPGDVLLARRERRADRVHAGTNGRSSPSQSATARPMRVMMRMFTAT
jgi:hypothetical protein